MNELLVAYLDQPRNQRFKFSALASFCISHTKILGVRYEIPRTGHTEERYFRDCKDPDVHSRFQLKLPPGMPGNIADFFHRRFDKNTADPISGQHDSHSFARYALGYNCVPTIPYDDDDIDLTAYEVGFPLDDPTELKVGRYYAIVNNGYNVLHSLIGLENGQNMSILEQNNGIAITDTATLLQQSGGAYVVPIQYQR